MANTTANIANSTAAKTDVQAFMAWAEKRQSLGKDEKERLAKLVEEFQKSCER